MTIPIQASTVYTNTQSINNTDDDVITTTKSRSQNPDELRQLKETAEEGKPSSITKLYRLSTETGIQADEAKIILANLQLEPIHLATSSEKILESIKTLHQTCERKPTDQASASLQALEQTFGPDFLSMSQLKESILMNTHKDTSSTAVNNNDNSISHLEGDLLRKKLINKE